MRPWRTDIRYHPTIGYTYIPNLTARLPHAERGSYRIQTNSAGFRCRHEFEPSAGKQRRVLLVGDSFTAGDCVDGDERFGDLLERSQPDLQVLNLGLSGTGTDQQLLALREIAPALDYDMLLVCPFVENIQRVTSRARLMRSAFDGRERLVPKPYFTLEGDALELHHVPVPRVWESSTPPEEVVASKARAQRLRQLNSLVQPFLGPRRRRLLKAAYQWVTRYQPCTEYDSPDDPAWLLMKAILTTIASEAGDRPVVLAPIPLRQHIDGTAAAPYRARFAELESIPNVHVLDVLPFFTRLSWRERLLECSYLEDWHWTARGHEVMAQALRTLLNERGLL